LPALQEKSQWRPSEARYVDALPPRDWIEHQPLIEETPKTIRMFAEFERTLRNAADLDHALVGVLSVHSSTRQRPLSSEILFLSKFAEVTANAVNG
jgi:hypothetical protein